MEAFHEDQPPEPTKVAQAPSQPTLTMPTSEPTLDPPKPKAANLAMKVQARKLTGPMSGGI